MHRLTGINSDRSAAIGRTRLLPGAGSSPSDPIEPWEIPIPKRDRYKIDRWLPGRPFRPTRLADIPAPALAAVEGVCGPVQLSRVFVVPRTTRLVDSSRCVITPTKVLGFGEEVVAVWIDDGPEGRVMSMPTEQLDAVDDRTILLYGRLRLIASDAQLVVHYNTVARDDLRDDLCRLRSQMATRELPVSPGFLWLDPSNPRPDRAGLPHKWLVVLDSAAVRPNPAEPVVVAVGNLTEIRRGKTRPPSGVAVLGPRELVIASEPSDYRGRDRYGVDLLAVPRERLDSVSWDGRSLTVRFVQRHSDAQGACSLISHLDLNLVEAMARVFGSAVQWT
jgi:hypothetical protein